MLRSLDRVSERKRETNLLCASKHIVSKPSVRIYGISFILSMNLPKLNLLLSNYGRGRDLMPIRLTKKKKAVLGT